VNGEAQRRRAQEKTDRWRGLSRGTGRGLVAKQTSPRGPDFVLNIRIGSKIRKGGRQIYQEASWLTLPAESASPLHEGEGQRGKGLLG